MNWELMNTESSNMSVERCAKPVTGLAHLTAVLGPLYMKRLFLSLLATISLSGCASMQSRFHNCDPNDLSCCVTPIRVPHYVYPGTQLDSRQLAIPFWSSGDALYDGMTCMFYPVPLIDLPLSFVADTLFLPYDIYMVTIGGKSRYRKDIRSSVEQGGPGYPPQGVGSPDP